MVGDCNQNYEIPRSKKHIKEDQDETTQDWLIQYNPIKKCGKERA